MDIKERNIFVRNIVLAILFIGIIVFISLKYTPFIMSTISNTEKFRDYILSYGITGTFVFMGFQISHIVIPVIPGEFVQIAGGYVYGVVLGSALLLIGTIIGTTAVFYLSRMIGYPIVNIFVSKERLEKFSFLSNSSVFARIKIDHQKRKC
ncbi:SNARE associated Golgi protein [Desulforamulus putei DSM 12395]|uniref:TVP38/TMEM64 family membrane protein n=1 Tax=Desulforamulus putei DSM 12395 TaxID=1121429 RepID=A0A1M5D0K7_9FIRM|nr:VTT domain-containing protein [Desulforamulus putei]SHF60332.1 SNARE associated Golgi protein [Desulforamulus putei DSM 12395]